MKVPRGYTRTDAPGAIIVARDDMLGGVLAAVTEGGTLYRFASRVPAARPLQGRAPAYAVSLPGSPTPVVVRHNRHGGALRALTGDLFIAPTRAPMELEISLELGAREIPTPLVAAYVIYPAGPGLARSDIATQEIPDSRDLGAALLGTEPSSPARRQAWDAAITLVDRLAAAGARHHDLNVKNVLIARDEATPYLLDVDGVRFGLSPRAACEGNYSRLARSAEKWRRVKGARITDEEIERLRRKATSTP